MSQSRWSQAGTIREGASGSLLGPVVGDYRIQEELGGSGGSQVFKAVSTDQSTTSVIKVFPAGISANKQAFQDLLQSLRTVARIDQPGVPRMIGSGMVAARPYIAMDYFPSGSLRERLEMGLLSMADLPSTMEELAAILSKVHSHGIVHGDLKPSEILLDSEGQFQLIGLGQTLPRPPGSASDMPQAEAVYQAPEVLRGHRPTPSSDQYSLAVIAAEMATGVEAEEALRLTRAASTSRPSLPGTRRDLSHVRLPPKVVEVLARATADDPAQRFPSVKHMHDALMAALHDTPLPAPKPPAQTPVTEPPRRKRSRVLALLGTTIALVLCFVTAVPAMSSSRLIDFDLGRYASLLVDAISAGENAAPAPVASPISLGDEPSAGAPQTSLGEGAVSTPTEVEGEPQLGAPVQPSADVGQGPTDTAGSDPGSGTSTDPADPNPGPSPTSTSVPTQNPTSLPTNTTVPTSAPTATAVQATDVPPTDPAGEPTINPNKCKGEPGHHNYCTPVP